MSACFIPYPFLAEKKLSLEFIFFGFLLGILFFIISIFIIAYSFLRAEAEEEEIMLQAVSDQIQVLVKDLKTLEKAVYQKSDVISSSTARRDRRSGKCNMAACV